MSSPTQKRIVLSRSERTVPANATQVGPTQPQQVISVSLIVRRRNPLDLQALGGRRVSREEFDQQYAADPADFETLRAFAHQQGLTVDETASSLSRRTLVVRGTSAAMEKAFGVELHDYEETAAGRHPGRRFHGFTGPVSLPQAHAGLIEAVLGLDARPIAKPHCRFLKDLKKKKTPSASAQPQPFNPPQLAALYGFPTGVNGSGETIGILELGGGYNTSDIDTYFQGLGLTPPTVVAVSVDGGTNAPGDPSGADGEVALDIQVAGTIASGARMAVYFAPNTDQGFIDAITTAVHDTANNPSVLSISWGGPESSWAQTSITALDNACQSAAALGVTITVASGDNGSSDGVSDGQNHVDFPASCPHVLACGGTELIGSGSKITEEVVWDDLADQGGATGGGYSAVFPLPSWQSGAGVTGSRARGAGCGRGRVSGEWVQHPGGRPTGGGGRDERGGSAVGCAGRADQPAERIVGRVCESDALHGQNRFS
jgi:kumamolisin